MWRAIKNGDTYVVYNGFLGDCVRDYGSHAIKTFERLRSAQATAECFNHQRELTRKALTTPYGGTP